MNNDGQKRGPGGVGENQTQARAAKRGWKFIAYCLGVNLVLLTGLFAVAEVAVRVFVPEKYWRFRVSQDDWQRDEQLGWINVPHLNVEHREDGRTLVRFETNQDGLQPGSARPQKEDGKLRVMLFGDSSVVGRGIPESGRLVPALERALAARGAEAEVICAGVQGYSTDQSLLAMQRLLPSYRPDVVIHMVCDNDFGGNVGGFAFGRPKPRFVLAADG